MKNNKKNLSKRQRFQLLPIAEQIKRLSSLSDVEAELLLYDADWNARPNQLAPPGDWYTWIVNAGRGFGKTKVGSWWILEKVRQGHKNIILVGATQTDLERIMINGDSGILNTANKWERPEYKKSDGLLIFYDDATKPDRKVIATAVCLSAQDPDRARGLQSSIMWLDEFAAYPYPQELYDMLVMGHRLTGIHGEPPQALITTTPRPLKCLKKLIADKRNVVTSGNTFDNADNLAPSFLQTVKDKYEGTRLGDQEIRGIILDDNPNALFNQETINKYRVLAQNEDGSDKEYIYSRVVVSIDPAVTANASSDLTGITVIGKGIDGQFYVIEDLSMKGKPHEWALEAAKAFYRHKADRIVAEVNNGGDMVEETIKNIDNNIPYKKVHATRGKMIRAEPVALLMEQGKIHMIGQHEHLEKELCEYTGDPTQKSPDRFDSFVWGVHDLSDVDNGYLDFISSENQKMKIEDEKHKEQSRDNLWF